MGPENVHNPPTEGHNGAKAKTVLNEPSQQKLMLFPFKTPLDASKFVLLSIFTLETGFSLKLGQNCCPRMQKVYF